MYSSISVANQLMKLADKQHKTLTPMQLIKLVYLCHAWMLGLYGKHLIDEPIEAWKYGPVIRSLYDKVKCYKSSPVKEITQHVPYEEFNDLESDIIQQVYDTYGNFTGIELSTLTHAAGSPWFTTWEKQGKNAPISNDIIENYYKQLTISNDSDSYGN